VDLGRRILRESSRTDKNGNAVIVKILMTGSLKQSIIFAMRQGDVFALWV
jgi:hypothetical protein